MHTHEQCARCGSREILELPTMPGDHPHIVTGDRVLHTVCVATYVCTDCGFVEQWGNRQDDLRRLKENLRRRQDTADPPT